MTSPLARLAGPGKALAAEPPDASEFAGLKRSGLARLKDAENKTNSLEGRFDLVYNAAPAHAGRMFTKSVCSQAVNMFES